VDLKGRVFATAVGSVPYNDARPACDKILRNFKDMPFWPQLVKRSFLENMYVQFSEALPGVVIDEKAKKIYVDTAKDLTTQTEQLYEKFLQGDLDFFAVSRPYAEGLYAMLEAFWRSPSRPRFLKGQVTGPVSFGLTVTDEKRQPIFYNRELKEALVRLLSMKAAWQVRTIKRSGVTAVIFIDEPYLASMGSSFISLQKEDAFSALEETARAIHKEGGLCGIHCCGNTDWGFILGTSIDIVNFDAYSFCGAVLLYPRELSLFLDRGGVLAWGLVPNTKEINAETTDRLLTRLDSVLEDFEKKGISAKKVLSAMLITPSCGLGLVDEETADKVLGRTIETAERINSGKAA
jgi:methionine synthase II (cobalamin-independent)